MEKKIEDPLKASMDSTPTTKALLKERDIASSSDAPKKKSGTDSHGSGKEGSSTENLLTKKVKEVIPRAPWQLKIEAFLDSLYVQLFMGILSLFTLFGDDIRMLAMTKTADVPFYWVMCFAMGLFFLEIFLASISKEDYFNGFFFYLDIISTVSMVTDIGWIVPESSAAGQTADVAKQARAGRAARVIRLIRLIRLIRITKLYKEVQTNVSDKKDENPDGIRKLSSKVYPENSSPNQADNSSRALVSKKEEVAAAGTDNVNNSVQESAPGNLDVPQESKVSALLSSLTTQRVVILIITLTFCLPLLDLYSYVDTLYAPLYAIQGLAQAHEKMSKADFKLYCEKFVEFTRDEQYYPMIYLNGPDCGPFQIGPDTPDDIRESEKILGEEGPYYTVFDMRPNTKLNAGLGIGRTLFLCILLAVGAILFYNDTTNLVVGPLESMIEKVNMLSTNPMWFCLATEEDQLGIYSFMEKNTKREEKYETQYLENLIVKIAKLLAVEFGEAGTKIVVSNLNDNEFLNPMVPGSKMCAVFGFLIINGFAETTVRLQEKVIIYLNSIAEVIHCTIDKYLGATNKNIGEAFLVLWKFKDEQVEMKPSGPVSKMPIANTMVDLALLSYLKIIAKINKLNHILEFAEYPEIKNNIPNYKLKMGFGMHVGWGIEGAIGSIHKIDASYLSPNVNISARLEAATKQYGVPILISGQIYEMLTPFVKKFCREIDIVTVKGSVLPIKLFTVDLDVTGLKIKSCKYVHIENGKRKDARLRERKRFHKRVLDGIETSQSCYTKYKDLELMRASISEGFLKQHEEGYKNYIAGNWNQAIECFKKALVLRPKDGPTMTLLGYMETHNGIAPATWKGYRVLTEK